MPPFRRAIIVLNLTLAVAVAALILWRPVPTGAAVPLTSGIVPLKVGEYVSQGDDVVAESLRGALPGASIIERRYIDTTGACGPIKVTVVGGISRTAVHDPRSCLAGAGWVVSDEHQEQVSGGRAGESMGVCLAGRTSDLHPICVVAYLYALDGTVVSNPTRMRADLLWDALIHDEQTHVYFMEFVEPLTGDPAMDRQNEKQLAVFVGRIEKSIVSHKSLPRPTNAES